MSVRAALGSLVAAVDGLQRVSLDGLDDDEVLTLVRDLETQRRRLPTVEHRLIGELECRSGSLPASWHAAPPGCCPSCCTWTWVRRGPGSALPPSSGPAPPSSDRTSDRCPPQRPPPRPRVRSPSYTCGWSSTRSPTSRTAWTSRSSPSPTTRWSPRPGTCARFELAKAAEHLLAHLDPDGQLSDHTDHTDHTDRAARRWLNIARQRPDGMRPVTWLLEPATRALVDAVFATLARPAPVGDVPDPRSTAQRNHAALAASCSNARASGMLGTAPRHTRSP